MNNDRNEQIKYEIRFINSLQNVIRGFFMYNNLENQIMTLLLNEGSVRIDTLVDVTHISAITIRRELKKMEEKGLLERFRGGAIPAANTYGREPTLIEREMKNKEKKKAIANAAVKSINKGDVIVIDLGTTGIEIAKALRGCSDILVFTANLPVANILMNTKNKVYLFGGLVQGKENSLGGSITRAVISQFNFDKFFLGVSGISIDYGITDFGIDEVEIKREIIKRSKKVICAADSSKFEKNMFIKICDYTSVNQIITDRELNPLIKQKYEKGGITLTIAE